MSVRVGSYLVSDVEKPKYHISSIYSCFVRVRNMWYLVATLGGRSDLVLTRFGHFVPFWVKYAQNGSNWSTLGNNGSEYDPLGGVKVNGPFWAQLTSLKTGDSPLKQLNSPLNQLKTRDFHH